jgi:hypothetical protein
MSVLFGHFQDILFEETLHLEGILNGWRKKKVVVKCLNFCKSNYIL